MSKDLEQQFSEKFAEERPEARSAAFTDIETSADGSKFSGLAAVYDQVTDLGSHTESINRGAFRKSLARGDNVPMLYDHNPVPILATTGGGTLKLSEDAKGLRVEANVANHYMGEAVRELVKRGDIRGMSFGFVAGAGNSRVEQRGMSMHRTLLGFKKLLDVSPTWDPAYQGTSAELRSLRALQMAEDIDRSQQIIEGAAPQLDDRATGEDEPKSEAQDEKQDEDTTDTKESVCETCGEAMTADHACATEEEQRSGVEAAKVAAAARRRRLQLMGLTLPEVM